MKLYKVTYHDKQNPIVSHKQSRKMDFIEAQSFSEVRKIMRQKHPSCMGLVIKELGIR